MAVNVSSSELVDLVKAISTSISSICVSNDAMKESLRNLGMTFQDEGFDKLTTMVSNSERNLREASPDLDYIAGQLIQYARLLNDSKTKL